MSVTDTASRPVLGSLTCEYCEDPLRVDAIWGPVHGHGGYLCLGADGEPLSTPATPRA
ncbi:hypothetical protein [Longispora albida]|uniref:hypothetical protein n=1 Tax=Longispora albida TaxID=203523 RepID=UPI0003736BA2|nr:hypothetical protein [Longispora albida]